MTRMCAGVVLAPVTFEWVLHVVEQPATARALPGTAAARGGHHLALMPADTLYRYDATQKDGAPASLPPPPPWQAVIAPREWHCGITLSACIATGGSRAPPRDTDSSALRHVGSPLHLLTGAEGSHRLSLRARAPRA